MEGLIELVAASFARHGIDCPAADSRFVWGRAPSPVHAERSSAAANGHSKSGFAIAESARPAEPTLITALPEHNYRKGPQADPAP
jgi:hypothetical protein